MSEIIWSDAKMSINTETKFFKKRWIPSADINSTRSLFAAELARVIAEDVNTGTYVLEYNRGNFSTREDYILYLANRIEFMLHRNRIV